MLLNYATEAINFQSTAFRDDLIDAFVPLKALSEEELRDTELAQRISSVIKNHTNINILISLGDLGPAIYTPDVNKNNPLVVVARKEYFNNSVGMKAVADGGGLIRGGVSRSKNWVTGVFADLVAELHYPVIEILNPKFTPAMLAATVLHEVGHVMTYYEMMAGTVSTNYVLATMTRALDQTDAADERETILLSVKKSLQLTDLDVKEIAKTSGSKIAETAVVTSIHRTPRSEIGSGLYDANNWEQLADMYVARCGAGRDLALALDAAYRANGHISFRSGPEYLIMEVFKFALVVSAVGLEVTSGTNLASWVANMIYGKLAMALAYGMFAMDGAGDGLYDRPGVRITRIKQQIIENLKDRSLSKADVHRLVEDVAIIDAHLAFIKDRKQFTTYLWTLFNNNLSKRLDQEKLQQELENFASNALFVKAANLGS